MMAAALEANVVMPAWVFLVLFVGGVGFLTFLMWANHEARHDNELRRLGDAFDSDPVRDDDGIVHLIPRQRQGGDS
jgi:hypothetical protein